MVFEDFVNHEKELDPFASKEEATTRAVARILEGYLDLEEARESADLLEQTGNISCDGYGFHIDHNTLRKAIGHRNREAIHPVVEIVQQIDHESVVWERFSDSDLQKALDVQQDMLRGIKGKRDESAREMRPRIKERIKAIEQELFQRDIELVGQMNKLSDQISQTQPLDGYYNAKENKRRRTVIAELETQIAELQEQRKELARLSGNHTLLEVLEGNTPTLEQENKEQNTMSKIEEITKTLIELKEKDESLDLAKAELLAQVKAEKLYKETFGTFAKFADYIGYHRVYCYDLVRVWDCLPVRESYSSLGAMKAVKIAKADLPEEETRELIAYAQNHTARETVARIKEVKNKGKEPQSKADRVLELLRTKERLEKNLAEVIAEIEALEPGKVSKPKRKSTRTRSTKPPVTKLGDVITIMRPFVAKNSNLYCLEGLHFRGEKVIATNLESYATLEVSTVFFGNASVNFSDLRPYTKTHLWDVKGGVDNDSDLSIEQDGVSITVPSIGEAQVENFDLITREQGESVWTGTLTREQFDLLVATGNDASTDDTRPVLTAVCLNPQGGELVAAAADGFQLVKNPLGVEAEGDWQALIPAEALKGIGKAVKKLKAESVNVRIEYQTITTVDLEEGGEVKQVSSGRMVATFDLEGEKAKLSVVVLGIEGKYPDYESIIPRQAFVASVTVSKADLLPVLETAAKTSKAYGPEMARVTVNGNLVFEVGEFNKGELEEARGKWEYTPEAVEHSGPDYVFAVNPAYLASTLKALPEDQAVIKVQEDSMNPVYIQSGKGEGVVMPMHISR